MKNAAQNSAVENAGKNMYEKL